MRKTVNMVKVS